MKNPFLIFGIILSNLVFISAAATGIPKLSITWDSKTSIVVIALGVALVLLAIYWILQSMMRKDI